MRVYAVNSGCKATFGVRNNTKNIAYAVPNHSLIQSFNSDNKLANDLYLSGIQNKSLINFTSKQKQLNNDPFSFEQFDLNRKKANILDEADIEAQINRENFLGGGLNSSVYAFSSPLLSKWAIKVDKDPWAFAPDIKGFQKVDNNLKELNFGQEIAKTGKNGKYHILKKIDGDVHSVDDWSGHIKNGSKVTKKEAEKFLHSLEKIAEFPQETFDDYANQLGVLADKGYKMDSINPNNLLINYDEQKINIIDFFRCANPCDINSKMDLTSAILDFSLFDKFYEKLDNENQDKMLNNAGQIAQKCAMAADKCPQISKDEEIFTGFIENVDKCFPGGDYVSRYKNFKTLLPQAAL